MHPSQSYHAAINASTKLKHAQRLFKRSQDGLFHGKAIRFGNNVPEMGHRTRRTWLPNIRPKRLKSDLLERSVAVTYTKRKRKEEDFDQADACIQDDEMECHYTSSKNRH